MSSRRDTFPVQDLGIASFLIAAGIDLVDARIVSPGKIEFIFTSAEKCELLVRDYCAGRAVINARLFVEGKKRARDLRDAICLRANRGSA